MLLFSTITGPRIFEKKAIDLYPAISLLASTNATVTDNNMIRPSMVSNALCEVNAFVNTYSQGSVKINPKVLSGTQYYGFVDLSRTLASGTDIRYGYYLNGNRLYTIKIMLSAAVSSPLVSIIMHIEFCQ